MYQTKNCISFLKSIFVLFLIFPTNIQSQTHYNVIEIGSGFVVSDMNNNLEVVGTQGNTPLLWKNGSLTIMQTLTANGGGAIGINNVGEIVGYSITSSFSGAMVKWDLAGNLIFIDNDHIESVGYGINDFGDVSGRSKIDGVGYFATVWLNNVSVHLNPSPRLLEGGNPSTAFDINNNNWAVGYYNDNSGNGIRPFVWKGTGNIILLPDLSGNNNNAVAINSQNLIVGFVVDPNTNYPKAVYWENEALNIIETPNTYFAYAVDINSSNEIIGHYYTSGTYIGFIFKDSVRTDLNNLLPPNSEWTIGMTYAINESGAILASGKKNGVPSNCILIPNAITNPIAYDKWMAGEQDTIRWIETSWFTQNIKCILNFETPLEQTITIEDGILLDSAYYEWDIPDTLLSYQTKIVVENAADPSEKIESGIFRIKPYILTQVKDDSTYCAYKKDRDQWGFSNTENDMWPPTWWAQFNYQGIDPFTGSQYSQWQGGFVFQNANSSDHIDWVSWVNTFSVDACYYSSFLGLYKPSAIFKWKSIKGKWGGSCFGIATTNALAFKYREEFQNKYPIYPSFINPVTVTSDTGVKRVVNELFTHQFGNPHHNHIITNWSAKNPNQTLNELKSILLQDRSELATLSFWNNGGTGGHNVLPYGIKQDPVSKNIYYIWLYDNAQPNSNNPIKIDTALNSGNGSWNNPDWPGWGGNGKIILMDNISSYFTTPTLNKNSQNSSPFIIGDTIIQIFNNSSNDIIIKNNQGETLGFVNGTIQENMNSGVPLILLNGSETQPYGYSLPTDNYSVELNEFEEDTVEAFFFTGNKSFSYERESADQTETDRLFYDGGVSIVNPDAQSKTVRLLNLINETTQEKLTVLRSIELAQNDSIKIENPDSNKIKLNSFGSAKNYDIELNYVTENGMGRFGDFNIPLTANTSHTFVPEWTNLTNSQLLVLVDIGNNGTIDDTLYINNTVDVDDQGSLLSPDSYNLAQNYPNPFNPVTTIQYSIPQRSNVSLKVYDVLGNEIATLVNEEKERGVYSINFDASQLASGIYLYRIQAGDFVQTKKMILIK